MEKFGDLESRYYDLGMSILCLPFGGERRFRDRLVELAGAKPGEDVLELGCGTARFTETLLRTNPGVRATGLDISPFMLGRAAQNTRGLDLSFLIADAGRIPLKSQSFDRIVAILALHEMPTPVRRESIEECFRILRPRGEMVAVEFRKPENILQRALDLMYFFEPPSRKEMLATGLDREMEIAGFQISSRRALGRGVLEILTAVK